MAQQFVFAGQGPLIMGEYDPASGLAHEGFLVRQRRIGCGNRTLKIALSRTTKEVKESCSGQGLTLARWSSGQSAKVTLELVQFSRDELALGLYGASTQVATGTVTGEPLRDGLVAGDLVHTRYPQISSLVIKDSAGVPATLTPGVNYEIDSAGHGRIKLLDVTGLTQPLEADYSYAAHGRVTAFTAASTRRGLIFDGVNVAQGNTPVRLFVPLIDFDPAKDFNWISQDEAVLALEGEILYADALVGNGEFGPFFKIDALPV